MGSLKYNCNELDGNRLALERCGGRGWREREREKERERLTIKEKRKGYTRKA